MDKYEVTSTIENAKGDVRIEQRTVSEREVVPTMAANAQSRGQGDSVRHSVRLT